jgi:hypothetical protein
MKLSGVTVAVTVTAGNMMVGMALEAWGGLSVLLENGGVFSSGGMPMSEASAAQGFEVRRRTGLLAR